MAINMKTVILVALFVFFCRSSHATKLRIDRVIKPSVLENQLELPKEIFLELENENNFISLTMGDNKIFYLPQNCEASKSSIPFLQISAGHQHGSILDSYFVNTFGSAQMPLQHDLLRQTFGCGDCSRYSHHNYSFGSQIYYQGMNLTVAVIMFINRVEVTFCHGHSAVSASYRVISE